MARFNGIQNMADCGRVKLFKFLCFIIHLFAL